MNIVNLLFEGLVSEKIKQLLLNGNWVIHKASVKYYALKTTVVVWKIIQFYDNYKHHKQNINILTSILAFRIINSEWLVVYLDLMFFLIVTCIGSALFTVWMPYLWCVVMQLTKTHLQLSFVARKLGLDRTWRKSKHFRQNCAIFSSMYRRFPFE